MGLFAVTTNIKTPQDKPVWYPFECADYDSTEDGLAELRHDLNDGLVIQGYRLKFETRRGVVEETERDPVLITRSLVMQVYLMNPNKTPRGHA